MSVEGQQTFDGKRETPILVSHREFLPTVEGPINPQEAVVIFQGFGATKEAKSYEGLAQEFSNRYYRRTIIINMLPESPIEDSIRIEALKAYDYLKALNIKDLVVFGYSEGGGLAINTVLAALDEKIEDEKINPRGLILCAPIGIYQNNPLELLLEFGLDSALTPIRDITSPSLVGLTTAEKLDLTAQAAKDVVRGVYGEAQATGKRRYLQRFIHDLHEIGKKNPRLKDIACPVILFQGRNDVPMRPKGNMSSGQMADQDPKGLVQIALEELFPGSSHVSRILLERDSDHIFPILRASQIARVTEKLLHNWEKKDVEKKQM